MSDAHDTIAARAATHGNFNLQGSFAAVVKRLARECPSYGDMAPQQQEALDQIITKISRICHGNPHYEDHWRDIAGYAECAMQALNDRMRQR